MIDTNKDLKWMFASEFDPSVFTHISYNENVLLCNLVAVMIDFSKASGNPITSRNPGPTYSGIINLRPGARKLDLGFHLAKKAQIFKLTIRI